MADLANQSDATSFGYGTIPAGLFKRASARVRRFARSRGYVIDAQAYTVVGRGPSVGLASPVRSITSVSDVSTPASPVLLTVSDWVLRSGGQLEVPAYGENLSIVYQGGFATVPDDLVEAVCAIASRMANTSEAAASGVQQETGGSESVTFGFDAYSGISDLTTGELRSLGSLFPLKPGLVVQR